MKLHSFQVTNCTIILQLQQVFTCISHFMHTALMGGLSIHCNIMCSIFFTNSPFFHSGLSPEANIGRFLAAFSNCLQQVSDNDVVCDCQYVYIV